MSYFTPYGWPNYTLPPPVYPFMDAPHYAPSYGYPAYPHYSPYPFGRSGIYGEVPPPANYNFMAAPQTSPAEIQNQSPQNRSPKRRRKLASRSRIRKPNKMKPERSALTNITNQLLTFLYLKRKNGELMEKLCVGLSREQIQGYYTFAKELKQSMYGCVNEQRLTRMWLDEHPEEELNYNILRRFSFYYL